MLEIFRQKGVPMVEAVNLPIKRTIHCVFQSNGNLCVAAMAVKFTNASLAISPCKNTLPNFSWDFGTNGFNQSHVVVVINLDVKYRPSLGVFQQKINDIINFHDLRTIACNTVFNVTVIWERINKASAIGRSV
eukprot:Lithocolla_globosa_v1_NODE_2817_length_1858_cov_45.957293.p3 type:complete len:133 gc:universal NODE_2817_length_1858_cov_45.957293:1209-1607(+)